MQLFYQTIGKAIKEGLKHLLSEKHLYQAVEINLDFIPEVAKEVQKQFMSAPPSFSRGNAPRSTSLNNLIESGMAIAMSSNWLAGIEGTQIGLPPYQYPQIAGLQKAPLSFPLPTINTYCSACKERWPFNPLIEESSLICEDHQNQCFFLSYQCQNCKTLPTRFLVRRTGIKLRLCGRDPLEAIPTPKELPKQIHKYYADAVIAHHAGQTLAALFLLRVFIEQYWQTIQSVKDLINRVWRASGEEQGLEYQKTLPLDFKTRFPSLPDIYGQLSAAIHAADANTELFEKTCGQIEEHFKARVLFKIN